MRLGLAFALNFDVHLSFTTPRLYIRCLFNPNTSAVLRIRLLKDDMTNWYAMDIDVADLP